MTIADDDNTRAATAAPRKKRRGYVLLEVAIGGIMAATVVGEVLVMLGDANDRSTVMARRETAVMLAEQVIEQARAEGTGVTDGDNETIAVPSGLTGSYTRTRTVTSGTDTLTMADGITTVTLSYKEVTVTVSFPNRKGTQTVRIKSRIYS